MFAKIAQAIGGEEYSDEEEEEEHSLDAPESPKEAAGSSFNFWGVANAVAETVKRGTVEIASTVRETDWRAEIQAFGRDVLEETEELGQTAVVAVEHAVEHVEQLPQHAQTALPVIEERRRQVQQQLGQYGSHIGRFGREFVANTTELFEQARDTIQQEMSAAAAEGRPRRVAAGGASATAGAKYSRLDSDIAAMQRDSSTYCDEPADTEAYHAWLQTFDLEERKSDIEAVVRDNTFMAELQARIVPLIVEHDTFWRRYFYRVHLLKETHAQRAALAARAAAPPEEEVAWDDDDPSSPHYAMHSQEKPAPTQERAQDPQQPSSPAGRPLISSSGGGSSPVSSGVAVSAAAHPSDEEPATASDSSSGADPWTVVTSPSRRTAPSLPTPVPEAAPAAMAQPDGAGDGLMEAAQEPGGEAAAATAGAAHAAAGGGDGDRPAAQQGEQAEGDGAAPSSAASPKKEPPAPTPAAAADVQPAALAALQPAQDSDDDEEVFDDTLDDVEAAPDDGNEDVDEDWGYEST